MIDLKLEKTNIMQIEKNKVVSIHYTLKNDEGQIMDTSDGRDPLVFIHGNGGLISGLETELNNKKTGDKFEAIISPENAYGMYNEEAIHQVPLSGFQGDDELKEGMQVQLEGPDGVSIAAVTKIEGDQVTLDLNHPMAGKTLHFSIEVMDIRDATKEELSHGHVHGPGGHHH